MTMTTYRPWSRQGVVTNEVFGLLKLNGRKFTSHGKKCEPIAFAEEGRQTQAEGLRACVVHACVEIPTATHCSRADRAG